MLGKQESGSE